MHTTNKRLMTSAAAALLGMAIAQSSFALSIADAPLYLGIQVDPNVFFMIDDSGSMDFEILTTPYWHFCAYDRDAPNNTGSGNCGGLETDGNFRGYARDSGGSAYNTFHFIFDDSDHAYALRCRSSRGTLFECSNETFGGNSVYTHDWRIYSSDLNVMYYDPAVEYKPWAAGCSGGACPDASFGAARSNPMATTPTRNLDGFIYDRWTDDRGFSGDRPRRGTNVNATATPNGLVDLWDKHTSHIFDGNTVTVRTTTYSPNSSGLNPTTTSVILSGTGCHAELGGGDVACRTIAQAKQNVANWYQYHRKRSFVTKAAVADVITARPYFRYGLSLINDYGDLFVTMPGPTETLYDRHNHDLLNAFFKYGWRSNGTPLRRGLRVAGRYYQGSHSSYASPILPADKGGACQKNFTVLFTDGYWNGSSPDVGNTDGDKHSNTLADVAKHFYDTDLSTLPNQIDADKWDPATHQHMVTFTVAFGVRGNLVDSDGDGWPDGGLTESSDWGDPFACTDCPAQIDDLWHAAYNSRGTFVSASTPQQVVSSLQAALAAVAERAGISAASVALNTGSISSDALLYQARFNSEDWTGQILAYRIISDTSSPDYGQLDASGSGPEGAQWDAGAVLEAQDWDSGRTILTYKRSNARGIPFRWPSDPAHPGTTELDAWQAAALNVDPVSGLSDGEGAARLRYLRGERSCEIDASGSCATGDKRYRKRARVLGDVINSAPTLIGSPRYPYPDDWGTGAPENGAAYSHFKSTHAARTPILYVGANDGMLHGFKADGTGAGTELLAYVPTSVYRNLSALTDDKYGHRFYVDGSPTSGDVFYSGAWHSIVVGGLNRGGQGIYALDVTNPGSFSENPGAADDIVLWEFTDANDADLGYTFGQPALVRMQNGKWAAVFGNGYNSTEADGHTGDGDAKLFILFIEGGLDGTWTFGTDYIKIATGVSTSTPNGLATVSPVDVDGDNVIDYIYGGDLEGNMWKFDVTSKDASKWGVAYKLFQACAAATCASGAGQPITTRPEVGRARNGRDLMVYFGTGRYLGSTDPANTDVQTFYGIVDAGATVTGRSALLEQRIEIQSEFSFDDGSSYELRVTSDNAMDLTHKGWYMDLIDPAAAEPGERVVSHPVLRSGRIIFTTLIPDASTCGSGGSSWLMELDARDGSRLGYSPFDLNNDRAFTVGDYVLVPYGTEGDTVRRPTSGKRSKEGIIPTPGVLMGEGEEIKYTPGTSGRVEVTRENPGPAGTGRQSWRQIR